MEKINSREAEDDENVQQGWFASKALWFHCHWNSRQRDISRRFQKHFRSRNGIWDVFFSLSATGKKRFSDFVNHRNLLPLGLRRKALHDVFWFVKWKSERCAPQSSFKVSSLMLFTSKCRPCQNVASATKAANTFEWSTDASSRLSHGDRLNPN